MTHWSVPLVGLPYVEKGRDVAGVDCWGLVCLALGEVNCAIPSYEGDYISADEGREIDAIIEREASSPLWREVDYGEEKAFDVLIFRRGRYRWHAGVVVRRGIMLHIEEEAAQSRIVSYENPAFASRLTGVYRWHELL